MLPLPIETSFDTRDRVGATVRILDDALIDQIAAGEVVERPASVVKELLENALDAGASSVAVQIEDGGRRHIRVVDDGSGMSREDAGLCIRRHATSKIATFDDLVQVATLGFRGEALPAIAAVSRTRILTRRSSDEAGTEVIVEGGDLRSIEPRGSPPGTSVEVTDLFHNVPARRKFLRARQTETSRVLEVCQRVALIRPELRMKVQSDGRAAREYLPVRSLEERVRQSMGHPSWWHVVGERGGIHLEALLAPATRAGLGPRHLFLYVNGRPIFDRRLARAVAFAYGQAIPHGHYPRGVLALQVRGEDVDVNAHPQKTEVRFPRTAQLVDLVTRLLASRLKAAPAAFWDARLGSLGPSRPAPHLGHQPSSFPQTQAHVAETTTPYAEAPEALRLISQLRNRYLVCEGPEALYVLDRQLADEQVRYEALKHALATGALERQALLFPDRLELSAAQAQVLEAHDTLLRRLGFEWTLLGERTYIVRAIPALASNASAKSLIQRVLESLMVSQQNPESTAVRALARGSAVQNGETYPDRDAQALVAKLRLGEIESEEGPAIVDRVPLSVDP